VTPALVGLVLVAGISGRAPSARPVLPPAERAVRETVDFEAVLKVERIRFTCDSRDIALRDLDGTTIPISLRSSVAMTFPGSSAAVVLRRTISDAKVEIGIEGFAYEPVMIGRTLEWHRDPVDVRLAAFDAETDGWWSAVEDRLGGESIPWLNVWAGVAPPVLEDGQRLFLQRAFSVPGGLAPYAPAANADASASFWALIGFLDDSVMAKGAKSKVTAAESGIRVVQVDSTPDAAGLLRVLWRRAWDGDHGVRDVGETRSKLEFRQRSEVSLDAAPEESDGLRLRSAGTSRLRGEIEFTTKNDSWPAKWTCTLELELDWKTRVDWQRAP
jgi:hypothetical protein